MDLTTLFIDCRVVVRQPHNCCSAAPPPRRPPCASRAGGPAQKPRRRTIRTRIRRVIKRQGRESWIEAENRPYTPGTLGTNHVATTVTWFTTVTYCTRYYRALERGAKTRGCSSSEDDAKATAPARTATHYLPPITNIPDRSTASPVYSTHIRSHSQQVSRQLPTPGCSCADRDFLRRDDAPPVRRCRRLCCAVKRRCCHAGSPPTRSLVIPVPGRT